MTNINDLSANELREAVIEESRGDIVSRDILMQDLELWRDTLVEVNQQIDEQFSSRKTSLANKRVACYNKGKDGRQEFFDAEAEYEVWKGKTNTFRRYILQRLREVKGMIKTNNVKESGKEMIRRDALREIDDIVSTEGNDLEMRDKIADILDRVEAEGVL